ncbi:MAG: hypothetical protein V3V28_09125 [Polaribacter sp.]|uniref:hypothetical protein n=1 Tax=Polaribacter sp. TaxID=1920175 RepID=UPI002F356C3B
MKKIITIIVVVLITITSCNNQSKDLKSFIENKSWIDDGDESTLSIMFLKDGTQYSLNLKDHIDVLLGKKTYKNSEKMRTYIHQDSPDQPKKNSLWRKYAYYKIKKDTLFTQNISSSKINVRTMKMISDTIIGIHKYNRIQLTAYRKENSTFLKGMTWNIISKTD